MKEMDLIENIYSKMKYMRWKRVIIYISTMVLLVAVLSIVLGSPFSHKESIALTEIWIKGWLIEYPVLSYMIVGFSAILAFRWDAYTVKRLFGPLMNIVFQECNATKLMDISQKGISYAIENKQKVEKRALLQFEYIYIYALNVLGQFEDALDYLNTEWHSKKRKTHNALLIQINLNKAVRDKDKELYMKLYSQTPNYVKKLFSFRLQKNIVDEKYIEAIALLDKKKTGSMTLDRVENMYFKAKCYKEMGDIEKAKPCLEYVIDNGGDLMYKKFALELFEQMKINEKNC